MISIERYVCSVIYDAAMCGCLSVESFWDHPKKPAELAHCQRIAAMAGLLQASSTDCALHLTGQWQIVGQLRQLRVAWWFVAESEFFFCAQVTCKIAQRIPLGMDVPKNDEIDRLVAKMREIISNLGMPLFSKKPFLAVSPKQYHHVSPVGQSVPLK